MKRDWDLVQAGPESGDCTAPYEVRFHKNEELTVKEFVDQVLLDVREWGTIGIYNEQKFRISGNPAIFYRYGKIKNDITFDKDILDSIVTAASAHGGWTCMDYLLYIKKGEKKMDEVGEAIDALKKASQANKEPTDKERFIKWLNKFIPDDLKFGHYHMTFDDDGSVLIRLDNQEATDE